MLNFKLTGFYMIGNIGRKEADISFEGKRHNDCDKKGRVDKWNIH